MGFGETFTLAPDREVARAAAERLFDRLRQELAAVLPLSAEVSHVGATAVPGCLTKGDLDVLVRVVPADFDEVEAGLGRHFARNHGSTRTDEFAAFEDEDRSPHLGIQLTARGGAHDIFHRFAEALRADPGLVRRYNALKLAFNGRPMADYRAAKDAFVAEVLGADAVAGRSRSGVETGAPT